jgi:hypothetical protein
MCDRLAENGWPVNRVNNGSTADKPEAYANKGAEIWFEARVRIEKGGIILPNDPELIAQLTSRRGWPDSKGRLQLESKADMRSRGLPSPDRADAVLGTMLPACRSASDDVNILVGVKLAHAASLLTLPHEYCVATPEHVGNCFLGLLNVFRLVWIKAQLEIAVASVEHVNSRKRVFIILHGD